jgi:membrane associated rhomboid family serine protease
MAEPASPHPEETRRAKAGTEQRGVVSEALRAGPPASGRPWWWLPPATALLAAATLAVSAFSWGLEAFSPPWGATLRLWLWNDPRLVVERGWLWQLLSANFVHSGVLHLGVNLLLLAWFGPRLEERLGRGRFARFYLGAGVFAASLYDAWALLSGGGLAVGGASACALAVAALHALCFPRRLVHLYGFIRVPLWAIVLLFVVSDVSWLLSSGGMPWVNSVAHLGGVAFAAGYWYFYGLGAQPR